MKDFLYLHIPKCAGNSIKENFDGEWTNTDFPTSQEDLSEDINQNIQTISPAELVLRLQKLLLHQKQMTPLEIIQRELLTMQQRELTD